MGFEGKKTLIRGLYKTSSNNNIHFVHVQAQIFSNWKASEIFPSGDTFGLDEVKHSCNFFFIISK